VPINAYQAEKHMGRMDGKVAIITGATGGIGSATARRFAAEGVAGDATDAGTAAACVARATERYGGLDTLFANAGIEGKVAPLAAQTRADFERVQAINVLGPWMFLRAAAPAITARGGGSILLTSSVAGLVGWAGLGPHGGPPDK